MSDTSDVAEVNSIPDEVLLGRAVRSARKRRLAQPRWVGVMHVFGLGSTFSRQLCRRYGLDPDEVVKG